MSRINYWSCSKFADWLRGTPHGGAKTADEWLDWKQQARQRPIRYWLAEEGLDAVQNFLFWPLDKINNIRYYINNRWITCTHALTAHPRDIKPGQWRDVGNRFLPCLFNELVNYVEIELAWNHVAWSSKDEKAKYDPPFWATGWFRWRTWRCPQAGLDNLQWQSSLVWTKEELGEDSPDIGKPTHQAIAAKEILELYHWWTEIYPNRPKVYDASGWSAYCEKKRKVNGNDEFFSMFSDRNESAELKREGERAFKLNSKIEKKYEREDEQMMIRLIKIRNTLWT